MNQQKDHFRSSRVFGLPKHLIAITNKYDALNSFLGKLYSLMSFILDFGDILQ